MLAQMSERRLRSEMLSWLSVSFFFFKAHSKLVLIPVNVFCFQEILCDLLWGKTAFLFVLQFWYLFRLKTYLQSFRYKVILFLTFFSQCVELFVGFLFFPPTVFLSKRVLTRILFFFFVFY